jgi:HEAT repeat protein
LAACGMMVLAGCGAGEEKRGGGAEKGAREKASKPNVVVYQRSRYSDPGQGAAGDFGPVTEEERELSLRLLARLRERPTDRKAHEEVLAEARTMESRLLLELAAKILESPDAEIRAQGLMLVGGRTGGEILPLIEKGLEDAELDVRQLAMETALTVKSPAMEKLVMERLGDSDLTIRQMALQAGVNQEGEVAERTLAAGMASPHEDVGLASLALAETVLSKRTLPAVIGALESGSGEVRESAREALYFFFHERFESRTAAEAWWRANGGQYDENLVFTGPTGAAQ